MPSIDYLEKAIQYLNAHTVGESAVAEDEAAFVRRLAKRPENLLTKEGLHAGIDIRLTLNSYHMAKEVFSYFSASRSLLKEAPVRVREHIAERTHLRSPLSTCPEDTLLLHIIKDPDLLTKLDCSIMMERVAETGAHLLPWRSVLMHPAVSLEQAQQHMYELLLLTYWSPIS